MLNKKIKKTQESIIKERLVIFNQVFFELIESQILRDHLREMIDFKDKIDIAKVDLMLAKLTKEIQENKTGGE